LDKKDDNSAPEAQNDIGYESWMYIDERITPASRDAQTLLEEKWPATEEDERNFVGEFMRASHDHIKEQEKLKAIRPEFFASLRDDIPVADVREKGMIPCVVFGRTKNHRYKPLKIQLDKKQIMKQMNHHDNSFFVTLFKLHIEGRKEYIIIKPQQVQYDPVSMELDTMTFVRWSPGKKTRITIPVEVVGERDCVGVKNGGHLLVPTKGVQCIYDGPGPLPRRFRLNVQSWPIGRRFLTKDLEMPPNTILRKPDIAHTQVLVTVKK